MILKVVSGPLDMDWDRLQQPSLMKILFWSRIQNRCLKKVTPLLQCVGDGDIVTILPRVLGITAESTLPLANP